MSGERTRSCLCGIRPTFGRVMDRSYVANAWEVGQITTAEEPLTLG